MKTIVIGDLHNHVDWIEPWLKENEHDQVIFLGDYFDGVGDTQYVAEKTARWLAQSVQNNNRIHLMGNHDMPYRFPANLKLECPGWTPDKSRMVNSVFNSYDFNVWNKIKLAHFDHEHNFIFSHAGLTEKIFKCCPVNGPDLKAYERKIDEALEEFKTLDQCGNEVAIQNADYTYDGITWIRPWNIRLLPGITQVVGHTPTHDPTIQFEFKDADTLVPMLDATPLFFEGWGGSMWNIDCVHSWVGIYEDGEFYCQHRDDPHKKVKKGYSN